jgi:hypothetical protein
MKRITLWLFFIFCIGGVFLLFSCSGDMSVNSQEQLRTATPQNSAVTSNQTNSGDPSQSQIGNNDQDNDNDDNGNINNDDDQGDDNDDQGEDNDDQGDDNDDQGDD